MTVYEDSNGTQWRVNRGALSAATEHWIIEKRRSDWWEIACNKIWDSELEAQDALDAFAIKEGLKKVTR